jgi:DNA polymerase
MAFMSSAYEQLLDATLEHLRNLKEHGVRFLEVKPETLAALAQASRTSAPTARAAPVSAPRAPGPVAVARQITSEPITRLATPVEPAPARVQLDPQAKIVAMQELRERALVCVKCPNLPSSRKNVVFGVGDINAGLMFVGEAPGADEDAQGEPFVGAAGQLLTRIIKAMDLNRDQVYIANILKCRPDTPGESAGNRKPTPDEMKTCIPYLHSQIDLIQPKVLVALGATAVEGLLGKTIGITKLRGHWQSYRGVPLMPTFHPAYLLRNQAMSEKRKVWEDMLQVMEKLALPISEKQRGFFLRA